MRTGASTDHDTDESVDPGWRAVPVPGWDTVPRAVAELPLADPPIHYDHFTLINNSGSTQYLHHCNGNCKTLDSHTGWVKVATGASLDVVARTGTHAGDLWAISDAPDVSTGELCAALDTSTVTPLATAVELWPPGPCRPEEWLQPNP